MVIGRLKKRKRPQRLGATKLVARHLECAVLLNTTIATPDESDFDRVETCLGISGRDPVHSGNDSALPLQVESYLHQTANSSCLCVSCSALRSGTFEVDNVAGQPLES